MQNAAMTRITHKANEVDTMTMIGFVLLDM